jgi:hypothetical protein
MLLSRKNLIYSSIILLSLLFVTNLYAASVEPQLKSRFGDWRVFTHEINGENLCYIASTPIKQDPTDKNWNPNFFISKIKLSGKNYNQPSLYIGYKLKEETSVSIKILNSTFRLATDEKRESAWLVTEDEEQKIVEAMKKGYQMIIKGTSEFGTNTTDHYSLKGVIRSLQELDSICP